MDQKVKNQALRSSKNIVDLHFAGQAVDVEIGIEADDFAYAGVFGGDDQRRVGKIHGPVAVFSCQFDDPRNVFPLDVLDRHPFVQDPFKKIQLCVDVEIEHMGHFRQYGGGRQESEFFPLYEPHDPRVERIIFVEQGDQGAGINQDGV